MSRRNTLVTFTVAALIALVVSSGALAATSAAAPAPSAPFSLSVDNNIVVHKDAPNLQATVNETNNSGSAATCAVYIPELNFWTAPVQIDSGVTTGVGAPFPTDKHSTLTYEMYCGPTSPDILVASAVSKVTMTGQAGH